MTMSKRYRIRKLTPSECAKLMGFNKQVDKAIEDVGVSKTARYRCYGNSIVVNCIELIFEHLFKSQYDPEFETYDENFTQPSLT